MGYRDDEWEELARQTRKQQERERRKRQEEEEDTGDDATELYSEVNLEEEVDDPRTEHDLMLHLIPEVTEEELALEPEPLTQAAPTTETQLPWGQLHPLSLFINLLPRTWRTLSSLWPILLLVVYRGVSLEDTGLTGTDALLLLLPLFMGSLNTLVHFLTLRYRVQGGRLEIMQGLLNKQRRSIDPARIQNVGLVRNPLHTLFGLVEVRIETAGDVRTEGLLSALTQDQAQLLMDQLAVARTQAARRAQKPEEPEAPSSSVLKLSLGELLAFGLSKPYLGLAIGLVFTGVEIFPMLEPEKAEQSMSQAPPAAWLALVLLAFAVTWVGTSLLSVMRHWGYKLERHQAPDGPRLRSEEGLLTRRNMDIPLRKVQLAMSDEPVLRRLMGFATLSVETAGLGSLEDGFQDAELVVPMVDRQELPRVIHQAIPDMSVDPWSRPLRPAHPQALYRLIGWGLFKWSLIALPLAFLLKPWGLLALLLLPLSVLTNYLDWQAQGWLITPDVVIARRGFWRRRTWILSRDKLQSVHLVQGPVRRLQGLGRLVVRVAGSQVLLPDIAFEQAEPLLDELGPLPELQLEPA